MIIVTGGAGFIGSALIEGLNALGRKDIVVVDNIGSTNKWKNIVKRSISFAINRDDFWDWVEEDLPEDAKIDAVFHLGACSSTTQMDMDFLLRNNVHFSMGLFELCAREGIPFIYASSAATYGNGDFGYNDDHKLVPQQRPINPYGYSKQMFDHWVLQQKYRPPFWAGLKFFNVFGPNEYHKGSMMSLVCKAVPQIQETGTLKLFKSYKEGYGPGEQKRDFVYVKDAVKVMLHIFESLQKKSTNKLVSGIYNVGTGTARTFADLGRAVFKALDKDSNFEWVEMPQELRGQYQYFTQADLARLRSGLKYEAPFTPLEEAVWDYVNNYMQKDDIYL